MATIPFSIIPEGPMPPAVEQALTGIPANSNSKAAASSFAL